ncbi:ATP-dependent RNA helicase HrpA [Halopseudomonas bauzanensis]|uniref:ATP-dependent RNA helicase HrpA n=1 Tax=Halopseudomonas bauzanensis TaxID=653930 RepID=A0A4U0YJQ5_9GAMM|nr:ATP-dependent RNA helicase HrpA [Halopseudomonas bauzanensis]TKA90346.1 ATP-dependent RNA helicase HrpA [Halopseudomonas bauzanensis]
MTDLDTLAANLDHAMSAERPRLQRQLQSLGKQPEPARLERWLEQLKTSCAKVTARRESVPTVRYDDSLPIAAKRDEIKRAIMGSQVVVIAGETGSGKTTQLPKICLELGRGARGLIGHTQPRRLAARSVASRVAEELGTPLGELVGFQVRFTDQSNERTLVKLMTDGILLAETQNDRLLSRYDTLIIDEAHERSLNIDFLLGYLKTILPLRPDLKVIITSATIDLERFSAHFNDAPIIEVSGRTFPVDVWYRPLSAEVDEEGNRVEEDLSIDQGILAALRELDAHERATGKPPGDALVFLPGEREIRDTADFLRKANLKHTEILPLYARLSVAEQQKIFASHAGRRVILSTNVAETSLTVPGIVYVIDPGEVRISRYSPRSKVQRLPIEPVSQASANQRKGRCGRVAPGICVRLYDEADVLGRPEFTDPEILRTNLAAVILQMLHLRLGRIEDFPFIEPPDGRAISDGFNLLQELGAVERDGSITEVGRQLARLPVDPRIGRMLIEAAVLGSLQEVLIIASALAVQDPRERPIERQQAADQAHAQWRDDQSDFAAFVNLWRGFEEQRQDLSQNQLRSWCRRQFLNYLRMREWRETHRQLLLTCRDLGLQSNPEPAGYDPVHKALLAGLLSHLGNKTEEGDYLGARQRRFMLHPSSALAKKRPAWVMVAELTETRRLYGRLVAKIDPLWVEPLAGHLTKTSHSEPHWEKKRGQVVAFEQVTLYGLIIVPRRKVHFGPIDPVVSRELFIRHALVEGQWHGRAAFNRANQALLEELDALEAKARKRDILVDDETLYRFFDQRVPEDIYQLASFERWVKRTSQDQPKLLHMTREDLLQREANEVSAEQYPDTLRWQRVALPLSYHFEPGHPADGVTLKVPMALLRQLPEERLEWLVPGLLYDKCVALVRGLPKALRKNFVPVPDFVRAALERMPFGEGKLTQALGRELTRMTGVRLDEEAWADISLEEHLLMRIEVVDAEGKEIASGRDYSALCSQLSGRLADRQASVEAAPAAQTSVPAGQAELPLKVSRRQAGIDVDFWPAWAEQGDGVTEQLFDNPAQAEQAHRLGVQRLLLQALSEQAKFLRQKLGALKEAAIYYRDFGNQQQLTEDVLLAAVDRACLPAGEPLPRSPAQLQARVEAGRAEFVPTAEKLAAQVLSILKAWHAVQKRLKGKIDLARAIAMNDIREQLGQLVFKGFVRAVPAQWLGQYPRYFTAIEQRLDKLPGQVQRDRVWTDEIQQFSGQHRTRVERYRLEGRQDERLEQWRWMLEEYRVSLFAQQLGTKVPVSEKRLKKLWHEITG